MSGPELFCDPPSPGGSVPWVLATLVNAVGDPGSGAQETWVYSQDVPAALAQAGQFRIVIDNEICLDITGKAGTVRTILRGQEGSPVSPHASGVNIYHIITAGALAALAQQYATAPIGAIMPYAGSGDPPGATCTVTDSNGNPQTGQAWMVCDGRLIDKTMYATFFARSGHVYNGGVDPLGNHVKIPDKRGRSSVGAINMGTSQGPNDNNHAQGDRGDNDGEVVHKLLQGQMPSHTHGVNDPGHVHYASADNTKPYVLRGNGVFGTNSNVNNGGTITAITPGGGTQVGAGQQTGGIVGGFSDITLYAVGGDGNHNNMHPYEVDSYIVRVA